MFTFVAVESAQLVESFNRCRGDHKVLNDIFFYP